MNIFATLSIPKQLNSDNGPPFSSQHFQYLEKKKLFQAPQSNTPYFPESTSQAEQMVKTIKK